MNRQERAMVRSFIEESLAIHDPELVQQLLAQVRFRTAPQGEQILTAGQRSPIIPILWEGLCRGYVVQPDGRDVTDCFAYKRGLVLWGSVPLGEPSNINMEVLSDCTLVEISLDNLNKLMRYQEMGHAVQICLFNGLQRHWDLRSTLNQHTAEERYEWFLENYPGLIDVVQKRHVASFLGLTPESLSRVRRNFSKKPVSTTKA